MRRVLVAAIVGLVAMAAVPVEAHFRWHPDAVGDAGSDDLSGMRLSTSRAADGRRMLRVHVDLEVHETDYDLDACLDNVEVLFDTRGDERADFVLSQRTDCASGGLYWASLTWIGHGPVDARFVRPCDGASFCPAFPVRFRFRYLRPTRHIRWFVRTEMDRAPDRGWFEH